MSPKQDIRRHQLETTPESIDAYVGDKPVSPTSSPRREPLVRKIKLTPQQEAAASFGLGTRAIVATAGSGKTTTMSARIARLLLDYGIADVDILATTFTRASAEDLRQRINTMAGRDTAVQTGTLHSFCMGLIQSHFRLLGYERMPTIIDESDVNGLVDQIILQVTGVSDKTQLTGFSTSDVKRWIAEADVRSFTSDERDFDPYFVANPPKTAVVLIAETYKNKLKKYGYLDFDSILVEALRLLQEKGEELKPYLPAHVFVDEAQDLSAVQWFIVEELTKRAKSLDVIGDDDQSIYLWRRALPWRFREFARKADNTYFLSSNRRCARDIVRLAAEIISGVPADRRIAKDLTASRVDFPGMVRYSCLKNLDSLRLVAAKIKGEVESAAPGARKSSYDDYAMIVRSTTHTFPRAEGAFSALGIPYRILGGKSTFDSSEAKFVRAAGSLVVGGKDVPAATGGEPDRAPALREPYLHWNSLLTEIGVSAGALDGVMHRAEALGGDIDGLRDAVHGSRIADESKKTVLGMISTIRRLRTEASSGSFGDFLTDPLVMGTAEALIRKGVKRGIDARRKKEGGVTEEMARRLLDNGVAERKEAFFDALAAYADFPLHKALTSIELNRDLAKDDGNKEPKVTLTTAHSSKGLEWRTVFVLEVNSSSWPSGMAGRGMAGVPARVHEEIMDEERRLLYVAVTRAKDELYLLSSTIHPVTADLQRPTSFLPGWIQEAVLPLLKEVASTGVTKGINLTYTAAPAPAKVEATGGGYVAKTIPG